MVPKYMMKRFFAFALMVFAQALLGPVVAPQQTTPPAQASLFLPTLDDVPYASSNFAGSGISVVGHRLMLTPVFADDCSALTNWTTASGTAPTIQHGKMVIASTTAGCNLSFGGASLSGDFDIAFDVDTVAAGKDTLSGTYYPFRLSLNYSGGNYIALYKDGAASGQWQMVSTAGTIAGTLTAASQGLTALNGCRFGTLRIKRTGNVFTAYVWDYATQSWLTIGSTTQSYTGTPSITLQQTGCTAQQKVIFTNFRSLRPSVTTGTCTLGPYNTVTGANEIGMVLRGGTGTVSVAISKGASSGAAAAASPYATLTASASGLYHYPLTLDAANPWIYLTVSINGGSTAAPSPEVDFLGVSSTLLSQANAQALLSHMVASLDLHTDENNRLAIGEAGQQNIGSLSTAFQTYAFANLPAYVAAGGSTTLTSRGTTFDMAASFAAGLTRQTADYQATGSNQGVVDSSASLPAIVDGRSFLLPIIPPATKAALTSYLTGKSYAFNGSGLNWHGFFAIDDICLPLLASYDPGNWTNSLGDSDADSEYRALQVAYNGNGSYNDAGTTGTHNDSYSNGIANSWATIARLRPDFGRVANGEIPAIIRTNQRNARYVVDDQGTGTYFGRSIFSQPNGVSPAGLFVAPLYQDSRFSAAAPSYWHYLTDGWFGGFDFSTRYFTRAANYASADTYTSYGSSFARCLAACMSRVYGYITPGSVAASYPGQGQYNYIYHEAGKAYWHGPGANDPILSLNTKDWETGATYGSEYAPRIVSPRFGNNLATQTNGPNIQGGFWLFRDTAVSDSTNLNYLEKPSTGAAQSVWLGAGVGGWRSGNATTFTSGNGVAASPVPMTDLFLGFGHHALCLSKISLPAGHTTSLLRFNSPPVPVASGEVAANTAVSTSPQMWAYQENADGLAEQVTQLFGDAVAANTNSYFGSTYANANRIKFNGISVNLNNNTTTLSGTLYEGADLSLSHASMTPATEAAFVTNLSRTGDVVTGRVNSNTESFLADFSGGTSDSVDSYTLTGGGPGIHVFSGATATPTVFGGDNLLSVAFGGTTLATLLSPADLRVEKVSSTLTRVYLGGGTVTLDASVLPAGWNQVLSYDVDGNRLDISPYASRTAGGGMTLFGGIAGLFDGGDGEYDITSGVTAPLGVYSPKQPNHGAIAAEDVTKGNENGLY